MAIIVAGRFLPKRFVLPLLLFVTALVACIVTLSAVANDQRPGSPGLLVKALPYTGVFVVAVVIWHFRQRQEEAAQRVRAEEPGTRSFELPRCRSVRAAGEGGRRAARAAP
jgi:hypothetical protein